jgi:hypothetical protein
MADVRKLLVLGITCICAVMTVASPASAKPPTGSLLRQSDLPTGWVVNHSSLVGYTPPCLASAGATLAHYPAAKFAVAGEQNDLAQVTERVISVPRRIVRTRSAAALRRYAACNGSTWTRGTLKFNLLIKGRAVPAIPGTQVTGFSTSISSPSTSVDPNPYPGLLDFAVVGTKIVILSMLFADIPVDTSTFDAFEAKAVTRAS